MTTRKYSSRSQQTTLTSSVTSGATSIVVANASILFAGGIPSSGQTFTVVINPDTALEEIVDVTSASSNTLIVSRAQDMNGGTAQDHSAGAVVRHMIIGRDLRESNLHIEATTGYNDGTGAHTLHGLSSTDGNVVGTAANQTLTNKTFTTPTINGATLSGTITSTATVSGGTITGAAVTGLSAPSNGSDATTKTYVDSILGSAVAASTSAASAAASATAAATSAASAVVSQTAAATSASSALTSQTSSATSATSAAASATAAATSATSAAASAIAAATSATSAAASATAAATSASSAATSATASANSASASATSASNAATSASSAAASTSAAAASATAAATSATSAAASATAAATSASSASVSQTAAATSATSAAASQTAAATSASSALASQTAAATSAASAATSATDAAASYDSFDDRYLGAKSTPPTVDNDGNALLVGALYFNSVLAAMYVWTGSAWSVMATSGDIESVTAGTGLTGGGASGAVTVALDTTSTYVVPAQTGQTGKFLTTNGSSASWAAVDALPSQTGNAGEFLTTDGTTASWAVVAGSLAQPTEPSSPTDGQIWIDTDGTAPTTVVTRWTEQPAAGTTVLTGNDDYSKPLAYSPGYEQVFLNGVLLSRSGSEYTATNGTSITLASATVAGDIVEVICPLQIATTDTYTQSAVNNAFQANTNNFAAGKNKIINGDFAINQRAFSSTTTLATYGFDRWTYLYSGGTSTYSAQTFTVGAAPVAGYEARNFARIVNSGQGSSNGEYSIFLQKIEDVKTFANQTITLSFWAKAASGTPKVSLELEQNFGTGGSSGVNTYGGQVTISTSWARYSITATVPSISGKTIGTSGYLAILLWTSSGSDYNSRNGSIGIQNNTFDFWGVQVEAGSNATAFQTATGTIQGELAACQRYYYRQTAGTAYAVFGTGYVSTTTQANFIFQFPVTMRTVASSAEAANVEIIDFTNGVLAASSPTLTTTEISPQVGRIAWTISGGTAGRGAFVRASNNAAAYVGFSAEL